MTKAPTPIFMIAMTFGLTIFGSTQYSAMANNEAPDIDDQANEILIVTRLTENHLRNIYNRHYRKAYNNLSSDLHQYFTFEMYRNNENKYESEISLPPEIEVFSVIHHANVSPGRTIETPGPYVAANFWTSFDGGGFHCGFFLWQEKDVDPFSFMSVPYKIMMTGTSSVASETIENTPLSEHEDLITSMPCQHP